ncbi:MAG: hypothetical protein JSW54_08115, partial [Fidelibacterota bacterium]
MPILLFALGGYPNLSAFDGQLHYSTYYDSNVRESLDTSKSTYGLTVRGRFSHRIQPRKLDLSVGVLTQANLDALFWEESKLILNPELNFRYALIPSL